MPLSQSCSLFHRSLLLGESVEDQFLYLPLKELHNLRVWVDLHGHKQRKPSPRRSQDKQAEDKWAKGTDLSTLHCGAFFVNVTTFWRLLYSLWGEQGTYIPCRLLFVVLRRPQKGTMKRRGGDSSSTRNIVFSHTLEVHAPKLVCVLFHLAEISWETAFPLPQKRPKARGSVLTFFGFFLPGQQAT